MNNESLIRALLLAASLGTVGTHAATHTASSNSSANVQAAINAAVDGDVVVIPNGSVTWTSTVTLNGKGVHLKSATIDGLTITHGAGSNALLSVSSDDTHHVEISGIKFLSGSATGRYIDIFGNTAQVPLLHDCTFEVPDFRLLYAVRMARRGGVIWNCTFYSNAPNGSGSGCLQLMDTNSPISWSTASTMGMADTTGTANTYIENCTFNNIINQAIDVDNNVRAVIRRNTFKDSQITVHGADTSSDGARHVEIYDNTFVFTLSGAGANYPLAMNRWLYIRGGTGVITGNVFPDINSQMWSNKPEVILTMQNAQRRAGPYPCPSLSDYPVPHQIGQSHDGTKRVTDPYYMWGNSGTGKQTFSLSNYGVDECGNGLTTADFVKEGRDFINGPKPGYTKFPYPHFLNSSASTLPPEAPTSLRVVP